MGVTRIVALAGALAMLVAIGYAFVAGDFAREGAQIIALPWGVVSLVDLYTGFVLFSLWIIYREAGWPARVIWVALMMVLGNFTAAVYVLWALQRSGGDPRRFFLGARA